MPLLTLRNIHLSYGTPLLDGVDLAVERGERVCVLGRNGEGKSTLLRVIAGETAPEDGERVLQEGSRVARLPQEVPQDLRGALFDVVADGLGGLAGLVKDYHHASVSVAELGSEAALAALARAQHDLEAAGGWQLEQRTERVLSQMGLEPDAEFAALSGGRKRRALLARALVGEPDVLLLDEPTNHLDVASIRWLEDFLATWQGALVFITHDRAFLRRLATRIVELDRGLLTDWPGDYDNYLRRRAERDNAEALATARFDKKLAEEEVWIRQGIKARRTRNEGRVRALKALREERGVRRDRQGQARIVVQEAERSGRLVVEAEGIGYAWDGRPVVRDFSTTILRGDRVGLIGPNGVGKTTLLNLLLGRLRPETGRLRLGTRLEVAYFDQLRIALDEERTVQDNVADGSDKVLVDGKPRHVISYLQDFLFPPDRCRQPVKALSGGERNRLLLAKLFARPSNLLVLDEPTNDLDIETLELLEERLMAYEGTLLVVSHDREFLDNVVTSTLVFEGEARVTEYVGGYGDWERQAAAAAAKPAPRPAKAEPSPARAEPPRARPGAKLSYKDQRELELLPATIERLEAEIAELQGRLADPAVYRSGGTEVAAIGERLSLLEGELAGAYARWEVLEAQRG
ncbi:MAG: ATP-binding cassette domain-containing protein [Gammaproteobacteria bacterium]|nr:ATP-binding cassette domain-containing protein [Gammaproteobacteria bacterium]